MGRIKGILKLDFWVLQRMVITKSKSPHF